MARDFKIELDNVEMINGSDDLLKDTKVTKVTLTGENKLNSLNSTFENCTELTAIEGEINLDGISDMTEMALNTTLDELKVTNPTEENIQTDNSLNQVTNVKIGGTKYAKGGIQDVVGSLEWTAENFTYEGVILDNVYTNSSSIEESKNITVSDTLEQKATSIEITGQTYENLVNGKATKNLLDEMSMQQTEGKPTQFTPHIEQPICLEYIEGQTYQNLVDGKGEYKLTDTFSSTWTESNNSIENPPSMIEIPEVWGNTVQGYANVISSKLLYDTINSVNWTDGYGCISDNNYNYIKIKTWGTTNDILSSLNDNSFIQLKANTTYSMQSYDYDTKKVISGYVPIVYTPTTKLFEMQHTTNTMKFTTDSTGKVFFYPNNTQHYKQVIRVVEGEVNLSQYDCDEMGLNDILSVGDLYVDTDGNPILDEEGNEQYKLEIKTHSKNYFSGNFYLKPDADQMFCDDKIFVKPSTTYTLSDNLGYQYIVSQYNKKGVLLESTYPVSGNTIVTQDSCFYLLIRTYTARGYTDINVQLQIEEGEVITEYEPYKEDKTTILMPQPLRRITSTHGANKIDKIDRLYWDSSKGKYIIEQNIKMYNIGIPKDAGEGYVNINFPSDMPNSHNDYNSYPFILEGFKNVGWNSRNNVQNDYAVSRYSSDGYVLVFPSILTMEEKISLLSNKNVYYWVNEPQYIETKILEKPSLETYSPKTYITTNTEIQPSQMSIVNKQTILSPLSLLSLRANTDYTLQLDSIGKDDKSITVNLGGTETTIQPTNDTSKHHKVVVRTPRTLTTETLELSGEGVTVNDVMLFQGGSNVIKQEVGYVDGIESIGELQEDGTYKIDILTHNGKGKTLITEETLRNAPTFSSGGSTFFNLGIKPVGRVKVKASFDSYFTVVVENFNDNLQKTNTVIGIYNVSINSSEKTGNSDGNNLCIGFRHTEGDYSIADGQGKDSIIELFKTGRLSLILECEDKNIKHSYERQSTQSILLPQLLRKAGDVKDRLYWDENKGHYCIEQNITITVFDGSDDEGWEGRYLSGNEDKSRNCYNALNILVYPKDAKTDDVVLCDKLTWRYAHDWGTTGVPIEDEFLINNNQFCVFKSSISTVSEFKKWISQNPITLIHPLETPKIIDLPDLNQKFLFDTYLPNTSVKVTNLPLQPYKLQLEDDTLLHLRFSTLEPSTLYTIQFNCVSKSTTKLTLDLRGTRVTVEPIIGLNHVQITTPSVLASDRLFFIGTGIVVEEVIVNKGYMAQYPKYFDGEQSVGELQDDGTYKIDVSTNNGGFKNLFDINNFFVNSNNRGSYVVSSEDNSITSNYLDWYYTVETNIELKAGKEYLIKLDFEAMAVCTSKYALIMLGDKGYNLNSYSHVDFEKIIEYAPNVENNLKTSFNIIYTPSSDKTIYFGLSNAMREGGSIKIKNIKIVEYNDNLNMDIPLKSHNVTITSNNPLAKGDKLYWNKSNKRYEIDRNGAIEVPTVEGDIIDLPRLYQKVDTTINISTDNIEPSKIDISYKDIH